MAPKRKRQVSAQTKGLKTGEKLQRDKLVGNIYASWSWVGTEVTDASEITNAHFLAAYGFHRKPDRRVCANKYAERRKLSEESGEDRHETDTDEVIVISDDEVSSGCDKRTCKNDPYCLNYLGQERWEKADAAKRAYMKTISLGENPTANSREADIPVGLQNLGATCYANAFLQVWFQDLSFRNGVYRCQVDDLESPIFQLQVVFAALQKSAENVFNPIKLVESLKLRASEQQDAQEFSKLFMSHLDAEFHKQKSPDLKHLVPHQFQGQQVYGTLCHGCGSCSERTTDFLELELHLEPNSRLEDRIGALLEEEILSDDNKYYCCQCDSLQDATRYSELRELPPVLHISLLRFVFDLDTLERKKSKNAVSFPTTIDMGQFVRSRQPAAANRTTIQQIYHLHGVLLHKGSSAYHGHYEAQVLSADDGAWYQFNDETVTELKAPAPAQFKEGSKQDVHVDRDNEIRNHATHKGHGSRMSSKDAYMLVYVKAISNREGLSSSIDAMPTEDPPPQAMVTISELNNDHQKACDDYKSREASALVGFNDLRSRVMDIYRQWNVSEGKESVVLSRQALEAWLAKPLSSVRKRSSSASSIERKDNEHRDPPETQPNGTSLPPTPLDEPSQSEQKIISIADIICAHGKLDPRKASDMKCIAYGAYQSIVENTKTAFVPAPLSDLDTCKMCVLEVFHQRVYDRQHLVQVSQFDAVCDEGLDTPEAGYWISKAWLKDWRLAKPKMHVIGCEDPSPNDPDYGESVVCEHGGLLPNLAVRRRISPEAVCILQESFPDWQPLRADQELCAVCEAEAHLSKEGKRDIRRMAEEEKLRLTHAYEHALSGVTSLLHDVPCAIVPINFLRAWKQWLLRPTGSGRPTALDTGSFLCQHQMLVLDPNSGFDVEGTAGFVTLNDWHVFDELYSAGPLIAVRHRTVGNDHGVQYTRWIHDILVCEECRQRRKLDYEATEVIVNIQDAVTNNLGSSKSTGSRQSRRLRDVKANGVRRRFPVTKQSSVKDLKMAIQHELKIPTISQRLSFHGAELDDNSATMADLGVLTNDRFDLKEVSEDFEVLEVTDNDEPPVAKKRRREEGSAFGGTLLGASSQLSMERLSANAPAKQEESHRACPACTYNNPPDDPVCTICDTAL